MDIKPDERKAAKKGEAWRGERAACRGKTERVCMWVDAGSVSDMAMVVKGCVN